MLFLYNKLYWQELKNRLKKFKFTLANFDEFLLLHLILSADRTLAYFSNR